MSRRNQDELGRSLPLIRGFELSRRARRAGGATGGEKAMRAAREWLVGWGYPLEMLS